MEQKFRPVLLGSDLNVYGMARSFHEAYGLRSLAVSKTIYTATAGSRIIDFVLEPGLDNPERFLSKLREVKKAHPEETLLLVPCGDGYMKLLVKLQEQLRGEFAFNCPNPDVLDRLTLKDRFYEACDEFGFAYPRTQVLTGLADRERELDFPFPVVVKASNSIEYLKCDFPGKKKAFVAQDREEYLRIVTAIYSSGYPDSLTIQEFIPGDDAHMRVLNCYVGADGKVKLMALGHPLLEEHTPAGIGNYVAILSGCCDRTLLERMRSFLETIGWTGFANFDMKYDERDGQYKLFETNPRQGRSSYYVTAAGCNLAQWLAEDVIFHKEQPLTIQEKEHLWLQVPKGIVYRYLENGELLQKARELVRQGKWTNSLFYPPDLRPSRWLRLRANQLRHYKKYRLYYGKRGLEA